jgi:hypothetical protein
MGNLGTVRAFTPFSLKTHFNIITPSTSINFLPKVCGPFSCPVYVLCYQFIASQHFTTLEIILEFIL